MSGSCIKVWGSQKNSYGLHKFLHHLVRSQEDWHLGPRTLLPVVRVHLKEDDGAVIGKIVLLGVLVELQQLVLAVIEAVSSKAKGIR